MIILSLMTPKHEVITLNKNATIRQTFEKMAFHRYTILPLIDDKGHYAGVISEGDLMWHFKPYKNASIDDKEVLENMHINEISSYNKYDALSINADFESLLTLSMHQNFIPIVDDHHIFIGIVKRSDILLYLKYTRSHQSNTQNQVFLKLVK